MVTWLMENRISQVKVTIEDRLVVLEDANEGSPVPDFREAAVNIRKRSRCLASYRRSPAAEMKPAFLHGEARPHLRTRFKFKVPHRA